MSTSNMADAATARREARRRRILENSHNRLQLISGKCSGDEYCTESPVSTVIPDPIHEISCSTGILNSGSKVLLNNGAILSEPESFDLLSLNHDIANHDIASGARQVPSDLASFTSPVQEQTQTVSLWEKVTNYDFDIVLLSLLIQLMFGVAGQATFEGTYLFLPVLVYAITKLIWFPSQSNSKLSNILTLVQGMSSNRVQKVIYITQCIGVISRNICVFLFTTICIQSLFITLKNDLIT